MKLKFPVNTVFIKSVHFFLFLLVVSFYACDDVPLDPRDAYTGVYNGEVYYHLQSNNPIDGPIDYDSTYSETIIITKHSVDSLFFQSTTFGSKCIPFTEGEEYLETYGSHAAFTLSFGSGGDSLFMHSYFYSGIDAGHFSQTDFDFTGSK